MKVKVNLNNFDKRARQTCMYIEYVQYVHSTYDNKIVNISGEYFISRTESGTEDKIYNVDGFVFHENELIFL